MPEGYFEGEIFCDGPGCQTRTEHRLWASSEREAFTKARRELIQNHGWVRTIDGRTSKPVDLCPQHRPPLPRGNRTRKDTAHA